ncbi:MAG: amino acid deaminase [Pseudonocardiales bacterium]|nr:MAG: amino acid deaminase [Pseudonocardiales bacterium]
MTTSAPDERSDIEIGEQGIDDVGRDLGALALPMMLLRDSALQHNVEAMAAYCAARGVLLSPHAKTTMSPQITARQLRAGAWGLTVANPQQGRLARAFGAGRVLIANEVADRTGLRWIAETLAGEAFELYCYVDSLAGIALLDAALHTAGDRRLPVLVEVGFQGGRGGARSVDAAVAVAAAVGRSEHLRLAGIAGYEGTLRQQSDDDLPAAVRSFCREVVRAGSAMHAAGLLSDRPIASAGGSSWFDVVAAELGRGWPIGVTPEVVLRSGCYVTHDHGVYARTSPRSRGGDGPAFRPAIEVWANVVSRPEPNLALLDAGRRDLPFDDGLPVPLAVRGPQGTRSITGATVTRLNDQHAFCRIDADDPLAVGDVVVLGISHPCTAFDKWRRIPIVDDADRIVEIADTYF